ncbi:MAG: UvrD-helicase domain-containing protein [Chitinophagales bacterium]|nr:UvrD-helicase domain-containing protein [Chitinophagales bacterium]
MTSANLVLCKASAGSGKTYTLAKMYLQIILDFEKAEFCNYDRILAITFTNKATEEMKSRILDFLTEISRLSNEEEAKNSSIAQSLLADNPNWDFQRLVWKAKIALGKILHDYSQFSIMTIDKFFNRIVKSFLLELKLLNMSTVSMDTTTALEESLANLLEDYSHQENQLLSRWLKDIATENLEEGKMWQPEEMIKQLSKELFKEHIGRVELNFPLELLGQLYTEFKKEENVFTSKVTDYAQKITDIIVSEQLENGYFSGNHFPSQTKKFLIEPNKLHYSKKVLELIDEGNNPFKKEAYKLSDVESKLSVWNNQLFPLVKEFLQFFREGIILYNTASGFRKYLKALGLLTNVVDKMKEYREKNGLMFISDNHQLIQKVVTNTSAPFLYERIGNKYRYILLDEFQDTSSLQWENLLPLIIEILSHRESCKVLIVGDAKQAIYRWRGGNFQLIQKGVQSDLKTFWNEEKTQLILNKNYRSLSNIITFNNQWISMLPDEVQQYIERKYGISPQIAPIDHDTIHQLYTFESSVQEMNAKLGGFVEWKFVHKASKKGKEEDDEESSDDFVPQYLKSTISRLTTELKYQYKDIAILVKTNKEAVKVSGFLKKIGLPIMTSEALLFDSQAIIQLILCSLRLLLNPKEEVNIVSVLYYYKEVHLKLEEHSEIFERREEFIQKWIPQLVAEEHIQILEALSIYDIVLHLIDTLNLHEHRDIYVEQFLDMVFIYQSENYQISINSFLEWWEIKERSISISGETDAIPIITIHKSKGLEFNVVLLPFFQWGIVESSPLKQPILWPEILDSEAKKGFKTLPIDFKKAGESLYVRDFQEEVILQACDNLNVAYVALTRAKEKIYVVSEIPKGNSESAHIGQLMYNGLQHSQAEQFIDDNTYQFGREEHKYIEQDKNCQLVEKEINLSASSQQEAIPLAPIPFQNLEIIIGEMIHEVLSLYRVKASIEKIFLNITHRYYLDKATEETVFERVKTFFSAPQIQDLYENEGEFLTERELVFEGNLYRFDLLILNGRQGKLYDFKTGQESVNKKKNIENIKRYRQALQEMNYEISETALIYIQPDGLPNFEWIE